MIVFLLIICRTAYVRGAERLPAVPKFRDIAKQAGIDFYHLRGSKEKNYIVETKGGGCAVFDYNGDGRDDIFFVNGSTFEMLEKGAGPGNKLYRNDGNRRFTEVAEEVGVADRGWGIACAAGDIDNDGLLDLFVTNWGMNRLYRNCGDGTFEEITEKAGLGRSSFSAGAAFVDMDRDGFLDLYVANYLHFEKEKVPRRGEVRSCHIQGIPILVGPVGLPKVQDVFYHNNGDGTFSDWSRKAGFRAVSPGYGLGAIAGDVNGDGWPDLYVANDSTENFLFLNKGDGTVREVGFEYGVAFSKNGMAQAGMGTEMGDIRGAGREDLFVANFENDINTYYTNQDGTYFTADTNRRGLANPSYQYVSWGVLFFDFDFNRTLDLMVANGHVVTQADQVPGNPGYRQPNQLFLNNGSGRFFDVSDRAGHGFSVKAASRGTAFADLDGDGDRDIVINNIDGSPTVLECEGKPLNPWVAVSLRGSKSNRFGVGAWLVLLDEKGFQLRYMRGERSWGSHSELIVRFGLGDAKSIKGLHVFWPSGRMESFPVPELSRHYTFKEGAGKESQWPLPHFKLK